MDKVVFGHSVSGIDELTALLTALGNVDETKMALENGLRIAASRIKATAKDLCPVDTGQLQNSIEVEDLPDDGSVVGVKIAPHTEYAAYVEYGTGQRGDPSVSHREDWKGQVPQPYLYPALKAHEKEIPVHVKSALQAAINKHRG